MGSSCCGPKPNRTGDCCGGPAAQLSQSAYHDPPCGQTNPAQVGVDLDKGVMEQCNKDDKCDGESSQSRYEVSLTKVCRKLHQNRCGDRVLHGLC